MRRAHQRLLDLIDMEMRETAQWTGREALSPAVRQAMATVEREKFVARGDRRAAYANRPLPIGHGQTISQPYVVAVMTELLDPEPTDIVLEVGTGCGYETAVLAEIVDHVYSVEVVDALASSSRDRLDALGYRNVSVRCSDGYEGWPEHAPFDGIIVTAAAPELPERLIEQMRPGGRMVIPIGEPYLSQELVLAVKDEAGDVTSKAVLPVAFVPMVPGD